MSVLGLGLVVAGSLLLPRTHGQPPMRITAYAGVAAMVIGLALILLA
jgi:hypothetical protein